KNLSEVEVECLPADIPHAYEVDITPLNTFEDVIRVSDLNVDSKVTILTPADDVMVTVAPPRTEEEMKSLEEVVTEDVTKVEGVIKTEATPEGAEGDKKEAAPKKEKEEK